MRRLDSQAVVFWALVGALTITFALLCAWEPVRGDGWGHVIYRGEPISADRAFELARGGYLTGNPRWGQWVLALTFNQPVAPVVLSSLAIMGVLFASLTLIRARVPDPSNTAEAWLLVQVVALALLTMPMFSLCWFYRPICANYVYPLAVQLGWLIPYRFLAARPGQRAPWFTPAMLVVGVFAGAGNEHTGGGLVAGAAICLVIAWRRDRRVPWWAIAGVIGVIAGNLVVLTAPGQFVRYGGLATRHSLLGGFLERGAGNLRLPGYLLASILPGLVVVTVLAGGAVRRSRRLREVGAYLAVAGIVVATAIVSPKQGAQLLLAPSTLTAIGLGIVLVEVSQLARLSRRVRGGCAAIVVACLSVTLYIHGVTWREGRARTQILLSAPAGSVVSVPAFTFSARTPFTPGDDLRRPHMRARLARLLGLAEVRWEP